MNEATVDILSTLDQALSSEPVKAAFYTDGLFYEPGVEYELSPGSWAVPLVLETPSATQHFGGFICGTVSLAQHSTDVENLALIAAAMWAIQLLGQFNPNLQVEFCYDSLNAGRNSQGSCASSLGKPNQLAMRGNCWKTCAFQNTHMLKRIVETRSMKLLMSSPLLHGQE